MHLERAGPIEAAGTGCRCLPFRDRLLEAAWRAFRPEGHCLTGRNRRGFKDFGAICVPEAGPARSGVARSCGSEISEQESEMRNWLRFGRARAAARGRGTDGGEAKASRTGALVAFSRLGRPVWTPRDYAALAAARHMILKRGTLDFAPLEAPAKALLRDA